MLILMCLLYGAVVVLACKVAYNKGRKDKWEDIAKNYICFHKDVKVRPYIVTIDFEKDGKDGKEDKQEKKQGKKDNRKHLTNRRKF